jgi:hypothetical protein
VRFGGKWTRSRFRETEARAFFLLFCFFIFSLAREIRKRTYALPSPEIGSASTCPQNAPHLDLPHQLFQETLHADPCPKLLRLELELVRVFGVLVVHSKSFLKVSLVAPVANARFWRIELFVQEFDGIVQCRMIEVLEQLDRSAYFALEMRNLCQLMQLLHESQSGVNRPVPSVHKSHIEVALERLGSVLQRFAILLYRRHDHLCVVTKCRGSVLQSATMLLDRRQDHFLVVAKGIRSVPQR